MGAKIEKMKIANSNFNEITAGLYLSGDKKGLVIDPFLLTGLERSADSRVIAEKIHKILAANADETVECLVFCDAEHSDGKRKEILLDFARFRSAFPMLNTVAHSDDIKIKGQTEEICVIDGARLAELAALARQAGEAEKAEHYCRWMEALDFYKGALELAAFLCESGRSDEAEEIYRRVAKGSLDVCGKANAAYGYFLGRAGRHNEAVEYLLYALWNSSAAVYKDVESFIKEELKDGNSPYWRLLPPSEFDEFLHGLVKSESVGIEKILLLRAEAEDAEISAHAKRSLAMLYMLGKYNYGFFAAPLVCKEYIDADKARDFLPSLCVNPRRFADEISELVKEMKKKDCDGEEIIEAIELAVSGLVLESADVKYAVRAIRGLLDWDEDGLARVLFAVAERSSKFCSDLNNWRREIHRYTVVDEERGWVKHYVVENALPLGLDAQTVREALGRYFDKTADASPAVRSAASEQTVREEKAEPAPKKAESKVEKPASVAKPKSETVLESMTKNARECRFNGGTVPFGYVIDKEQRYQIDTALAPIAVEMFERYANGESMAKIVDDINARGIRTSKGNPFNKNSLPRIFTNRNYIGEYVFKDVVIPDGIPAIVSKELFERVEQRISKNKLG